MTPRQIVEAFYADIWNRNDKSRIPELLQPGFTFRGSLGSTCVGHAEFASYVDSVHEALESYHCEIVELVIENKKAFARMRFSGLHRGVFFGYPPTGKKVEWVGAALFTFQEGKVADLWVLGDVHGLLHLLQEQAEA